jgi:gamma-glutamyltranspeptidase/glutathione hydrolase/leukotriene-C4 hydrolase
MLKNPDWSAIFAPHGRLLEEGDVIHRTNLSRTLSTIAEQGADAFYTVSCIHIPWSDAQ